MFAGAGTSPGEMGLDRLLATMPVLEMDSLAGAYKIGKLKKSWPFKQTVVGLARGGQAISGLAGGIDSTSLQGRLAYGIVFENLKWEDAMDTLYNYYAGVKDWMHAVKVVEALVLEHPTEADLYDRAANIYGQMGDNENAAFYFRRSYTIAPTFDKARTIFVLCLKLDRPVEALPFLDYAMRNNAGQTAAGWCAPQFIELVFFAANEPGVIHGPIAVRPRFAATESSNTFGRRRAFRRQFEGGYVIERLFLAIVFRQRK